MLKPKDIFEKDFKKALRGYDMDDVDQFFDLMIKDFEELHKQNEALQNTITELNTKVLKYSEIETNLNRALVLADKTADTLKTEAMAEKDRIIADAKMKASEIINTAEVEAKNFHITNLELINKAEAFKHNLVAMLEKQIQGIKESSVIEADILFKKELEDIAEQNKMPEPEMPEVTPPLEQTLHPQKNSDEPDFSDDYDDSFDSSEFDEEEEAFKNQVFNYIEK